MRYLLDTNICIYLIRQKPVRVIEKFKKQPISSIGISSITLSELEYGVEKSSQAVRNRMALNEFLAPLDIYPYNDKAALWYGRIRAWLEAQGTPIGSLDTLIAAHCLSLGTTLITNNTAEFKRVPELKIENWV
jgi:tRNA(fMet)-specific endonuclease VapC